MFLRRSSIQAVIVALIYGAVAKLSCNSLSSSRARPRSGLLRGLRSLSCSCSAIASGPPFLSAPFLLTWATAGNFATSLCIASGNSLEALCGAWLINQFAGGTGLFDRAQDIFKFVLIAAVSTAVSASIGATSLALAGFVNWEKYGAIWLTWWLGDMTGYLVVAPLVLLWWIRPRWE